MRRLPTLSALRHHRLHVPRREELPLLQVDRAAGLRRRRDQVGLARKQRRNLQHVDHLGRRRRLRRLMDVGQHRQPGLALDPLEHRASPPRRPGPRNEPWLVRLALSNDDLKTIGTPLAREIAASRSAWRRHDSALSITHGPAISTRRGPPKTTPPASTWRHAHETDLQLPHLRSAPAPCSARRCTAARISPRNSG